MPRDHNINVLLVEDSPTDALLTREALSGSPHIHLRHTERLEDAFTHLAKEAVDVVLLDLGLPDSQGLATLANMRKHAPHCAIVVLTARDDEELGLSSLHAGAQDYLVKSQVVGMDVSRSVLYALERQSIEESLRQSEERFRLMVEGVKDYALYLMDPTGNLISWNLGAEQILGYHADEVIGRSYARFFLPEDVAADKPQQELAEAAANGWLHEEGWRLRKDGSRFWSNGALTALFTDGGELRGFAKITRDLTERRRLEALFRSIFDHALDAIVTADEQGKIILFNKAAEKLFGYPAGEAIGLNVRVLMPEPHQSNHDGYIGTYLRTGQAKIMGQGRELEGRRKDGSAFALRLEISEFFLDDKRHFIGIVQDITEQQHTKAKLRQLAAIVESSNDAIIGVSLDGTIETWNLAAEQVYGYSAAEAIGKPFTMLVLPERFGSFADRLRISALGAPAEPYETVRIRKDGKRIDVAVRFSAIRNGGGLIVGVSAFSRDISDRKKLEEQLRQTQKLEAIGQLAGGVAHDFNNLLTIISGFSELLLGSLDAADPNKELIQQIHKAGERAAGLTRQLLAFSRKSVLEPRVLDLNAVITDTEKMLKRLIGEDIILTTALGVGLSPVKVDAGQIDQVIMNLAVNARDAMPRGGNLTIETNNVELDAAYAATHVDVQPGRYVRLAVTDTGSGMTPEVQSKIFEPFFTTKGPGKGTGLGLATVYGIVKESGGHISIYSEVDRGTSFMIFLPAVEEAISTGKSWHGSKTTPHGTETILYVEDEDAVRAMTRLALQQFGYTVVEASRGAEAVRRCREFPGRIHLLITDVIMPEMAGPQLVERLALIRPGLKVLYLSGYTDDAVVRHGILQADVAFLQKPFTMVALTNKVREVLDAAE